MTTYTGTAPLFRRTRKRARKPSRPDSLKPRKFLRIDKGIRETAASLTVKVGAEVTRALEGPRTADEIARLKAVQHECKWLWQATIALLETLHGVERPER